LGDVVLGSILMKLLSLKQLGS